MVKSEGVVALEALARTRFGLFTAAEAEANGVSSELISHHCRAGGRWSRLLPEVYGLSREPSDPRRHFLAALLWAGDGAALSHRAAAWILRLDGMATAVPEIRAPRSHAPAGVILHRGVVAADQLTRTGLLRHTTPLRTIVDLAAVLDDDTLELAVESAIRRAPQFEGVLRREGTLADGSRGRRRLERVLSRRPPGSPPTDSELETRYLQVIRGTDLPAPVRQHRVFNDAGRCIGRLDLCWPEAGLWVELDGRTTHDRPSALLYDRHRQNELAVHLQWLPLRFTWDDVLLRPTETARLTEHAYGRRWRDCRSGS